MSDTSNKNLKEARDLYFQVYFDSIRAGVDSKSLIEAAQEYISNLELENHRLSCLLAEHQHFDFPRLKDLKPRERKQFSKWLGGQTRPYLKGLSYDEQDGYYPWDYERWKRSLDGVNEPWD
jgi:hypothetical protein